METDTDPVWANAVVIYNPLPELLRSPRHALHPELEKPLPLPCCRGEGRGEGAPSVVYPAVLSVGALEHLRYMWSPIELYGQALLPNGFGN